MFRRIAGGQRGPVTTQMSPVWWLVGSGLDWPPPSLCSPSHDRTSESRSTPPPPYNTVLGKWKAPCISKPMDQRHTLCLDKTGQEAHSAQLTLTRSSKPGVTVTSSTFSPVVEAELVALTSVFYCCNFFSLWHPWVSLPCDCLWRPFFPT